MNMTATKLSYSVCGGYGDNAVPVIIVAAGNSTRMGGEDKQLISVAGIPVIARTLLQFEKSPDISRIILVTRNSSIPAIQQIAEKYLISKLTDIAEGGQTRQESVLCGIERLRKDENKVLISDGARMFVTGRMISDCVSALKEHDGCLCAIKVTDTVKSAEGGKVTGTVDRSGLYLAQTPQGVTVDLYKKSVEDIDVRKLTDDASVLEAKGFDVVIVEGDIKNIKITTPGDLKLAEMYIKEN